MNNEEFDLNKHETESLITKLKEELGIEKSRYIGYTVCKRKIKKINDFKKGRSIFQFYQDMLTWVVEDKS